MWKKLLELFRAFGYQLVMRGLVACVGSDYCHFALIETKSWAIEVARELDKRRPAIVLSPLAYNRSCGLFSLARCGAVEA